MPEQHSRRSMLRATAGATIGMTGLFGTASAADVVPTGGTAGPEQDLPYQVVTYEKSEFQPAALTVPVGATVRFLGNRYPHTVTSTGSITDATDCSQGGEAPYNGEDASEYDGQKNSEGVVVHTVEEADEPFNVFLESAGIAEITFEAAGRYPYYCIPHCAQFMVGEVIVGGEGSV